MRAKSRRIVILAGLFTVAVAAPTVATSGALSAAAATSTPGTPPATPEAAAAAASDRIAPFIAGTSQLSVDVPLSGVPASGVKVAWLEGNIPAITAISPGFQSATDALGWDLTTISYDAADPQGPSSSMQQAVEGGADYIAISGQATAALGEGLDAAKAAGIPVINMYSSDNPAGDADGVYANIGGVVHTQDTARALADFVIADSGGDAHVVFANVPDFPILQIFSEAAKGEFASACPDCTINELDISIADLTSGAASSQIISTMQQNPDTDYVMVSIGDMSTGLPEAIDSAGMHAGIVGWGHNPTQLQYLIDGTALAFAPGGSPAGAWYAVDAMARLSLGMDPLPDEHDALPVELLTSALVTDANETYQGPAGYEDEFLALWGVQPQSTTASDG